MTFPQTGSRLVRALSDLSLANVATPRRSFALRMGGLIDLSDSISLSATHLNLSSLPFEQAGAGAEAIRRDFLDVRATLIQSVLRSFVPGGNAGRLQLPLVDPPAAGDSPDIRPYLRFYAAHQRDMEFRVRNLQDRVRIALSGLSPRLAKLVALESALDQTLVNQHRQSFAAVPALLERRMRHLKAQHLSGATLLTQCQRDLRSLLLAEIDTRLLPVQGLIEAIDEDQEITS